MYTTTSAAAKKFSTIACIAMFAIAGALTLTPAATASTAFTTIGVNSDNNGWQ
ncbi:hypothetical protein ACWEIJ_37585 [Lentzea sp. NPDC004789]